MPQSKKPLRELAISFSPKNLALAHKNEDVCYVGNYPTLQTLDRVYGEGAASFLLVPYITDLAVFAGVSPSTEDVKNLCEMIACEYWFLKITEVMLFFWNFKAGMYEKFYGKFSSMDVMVSLRRFVEERRYKVLRIEARLKQREREAEEARYLESKKQDN